MNKYQSQIYKYGGIMYATIGGIEMVGTELIHQYQSTMQDTLENSEDYHLFLMQGVGMCLYGLATIGYCKYLAHKDKSQD